MNIDITGALFILRNQDMYTYTQCKEGASDFNVYPIKFLHSICD